jgi:hypothetical protein
LSCSIIWKESSIQSNSPISVTPFDNELLAHAVENVFCNSVWDSGFHGLIGEFDITAYQTQYNQLGLHEMEPRPFEAMFVMLYYLEGVHMLLKMSFVTVSGTVAFMA